MCSTHCMHPFSMLLLLLYWYCTEKVLIQEYISRYLQDEESYPSMKAQESDDLRHVSSTLGVLPSSIHWIL